jgi:outer membrane protein OmpA-like peptidoglycan-associated protein
MIGQDSIAAGLARLSRSGSSRRQRTGSAIGRLALIGMAVAVVHGLAGDGELQAQSREVLIGTTTVGDGRSERGGESAAQMLAEAIVALEQGDIMLGRQMLGRLIQAYPESMAANTARRELAELYRGQPQPRLESDRGPTHGFAGNAVPDARPRTVAPPERRAEPRTTEGLGDSREHQVRDRALVRLRQEFQFSTSDRVFFADGSADLGARARAILSGQARWLARHPELPILIEAHSDDHGSRSAQMLLAERRGEAVKERLIEEGLDAGRIMLRVVGRDQPIATCGEPECAAQNRRVVTRLGEDAMPVSGRGRGADHPGLATAPRLQPTDR